jgi:hypothetical protein
MAGCLTDLAMRQTRSSMDIPLTRCSGFPGKREDEYRAGITITVFIAVHRQLHPWAL